MPPRKEIFIGDVDTSATGQLLQQIADKMDSIKTSKEMNEILAHELKLMANKVNDHDMSIAVVAKAMEDMNANAQEFNAILKAMQKDTNEYQKENQRIMMKMESILEVIAKYEPRFQKIEDRQIEGCPSSLSARQAIATEMRHQDAILDSLRKGVDKNREEINEIRTKQDVAIEQIKVGNKRTKDLEDDVGDIKKTFQTDKDSMYKALITLGVTIIGTLIVAIWGMVSK